MRCSRPLVPGTAHGRASVSGSRWYGRKLPVDSGAFFTAIEGMSLICGIFHGSAPVAKNASLR